MKIYIEHGSLDEAQRNQGVSAPNFLDYTAFHQGYRCFIDRMRESH